jgi:GMP synthase (glutamine-hydrolysing)
LQKEIYNRQPFPGPGLAIRIICGNKPYITNNSEAIKKQLANFDDAEINVSLLPIKSVGVQGDGRTYAHLAGLSGKASWKKLKQMADQIPRDVHDVNRVAYIFGEPISENLDGLTPTFLTKNVVGQLKQVDALVNHQLEKHGLDKALSQVPVILLPLNFGETGKRSVAIRTFKTTNFKTGDVAIPGADFPEKVLHSIVNQLLQLPGIARVMYDLTSKPPATTEWE